MDIQGFSKDLNDIIEFPKQGIFSKVLAKDNNYNYTLMCLSKGSQIDDHTSTKNGVVYVIKGKGIFNLEGKDIDMKPNTFIFMPKDAVHNLNAQEDTAIILCLTS